MGDAETIHLNRRLIIAAALGGVAYAIAPPPGSLWPVGLVALAPAYWSVSRGPSLAAAFGVGMVTGCTAVMVGCRWIPVGLADFSGVAPLTCALAFALYALVEGARFGVACALAWKLKQTAKWNPLVFALSLVAVELIWPQIIRWPFGTPLAASETLVQLTAIGGAPVLTVLLALAGGATAELFDRAATVRERVARATPYLGALALAAVVGTVRLSRALAAPADPVRIGLVQGGVAPEMKRRHPEQVLAVHDQLSRQLVETEGVDLLVWGEATVAPALPARDFGNEVKRRIGRTLPVPTVIGALVVEGDVSEAAWNSALIVGTFGQPCSTCRYDKQELVPLSESLPSEGWRPWFPQAARLSRGPMAGVMDVGGHPIATAICFEVLSAPRLRALVRDGRAELLVNLSNDGWSGAGAGPSLHLMLARLRAVELGRYLVRVAQGGISAVIDPQGRTVATIGFGERRAVAVTVGWLRETTVYARFGDTPWYGAVGVLLAMTALNAAGRRNRRRLGGCPEGRGPV